MKKHRAVYGHPLEELRKRELIYEPATASFVEPVRFKPVKDTPASIKRDIGLYLGLLGMVGVLYLVYYLI